MLRWALAGQAELLAAAGEPREWLSSSELARWSGFSHAQRRQSFVAGRWLARRLLEGRSLEIDEQGRSCVAGDGGQHLSISHSGEHVACAVADAPVGIDIERLRPRRDLLSLAATVMSEAQCAELATLAGGAQMQRFYQWWTLKEAWLKRQGAGLDLARMRDLEFLPCDEAAATALSLLHSEQGLALAIVGKDLQGLAFPPACELLQWLRD